MAAAEFPSSVSSDTGSGRLVAAPLAWGRKLVGPEELRKSAAKKQDSGQDWRPGDGLCIRPLPVCREGPGWEAAATLCCPSWGLPRCRVLGGSRTLSQAGDGLAWGRHCRDALSLKEALPAK